MKKVCIITTVHAPLDTRIFYHEALSLKKFYKVVLVSTTERDFSEQGVEIKGLGGAKNRLERFTKMFSALSRALEEKADIYHFHDLELIPAGVILKLITGKPVVYDVHENNPEYILDKEWIPTPALRKIVSVVVRLVENLAAKVLSGVIVINERLLIRFKKLNNNTELIMNFPNKSFGKDFSDEDIIEREKTAIFIGGIEKERGVMKVLEFVKKYKNYYLKFLFVGEVKDIKLRKEIQNFIKRSKISKAQFEMINQVPRHEVTRYLNRAYVGVIPFLNTKNNYLGTPQKTFEYMAYGLPIVASDFLFLRKFIGESESGILIKDPESIFECKEAFDKIKNEKVWKKLSLNGREAFMERFNWEKEEKKLFILYERLLEN